MSRQLRALPTGERNLYLALGASFLLHAGVFSLHFTFPDASRAFQEKALDIILVNSKSARKPTNAQALAQANLDGGGNTEHNRRAGTPLPPSDRQQSGNELEQAEKRVQALEAQQQRLLTQARGNGVVTPKNDKEAPPEPTPGLSGRDLARNALEMVRLEGEIARDIDEYNKRPRKKFIGTRTDEYRFAQYIEDWRFKVERVGTLNYPEEAKGKLYGSLILSVTIKSDGTVANVEINRSSGYRILDDAARRIVSMAGPYAVFPPDIQRDTDILVITRSWNFTSRNNLETNAREKGAP
ncbi:energy transducer TonB [Propionivibrio sp.]|uniref:energy transducer TonB n=1 Tax=Propionivibrio sp. TaxID=2212460 RepID=UPI0026046E2A|nr:energy transducer TonB [Propionivibrio sp.]